MPRRLAAVLPSTTVGRDADAGSSHRPSATLARRVSSRSRSAAVTLMPPVRPLSMRSVRRTVASTVATAEAASTGPTRWTMARASGESSASPPKMVWPAVTRSMLVPSRSSWESRSERLDSLMTRTPTMAAMPIAMPIIVRAERTRLARSPMAPRPTRSAGCSRLGLGLAAPRRRSSAGAFPGRAVPGTGRALVLTGRQRCRARSGRRGSPPSGACVRPPRGRE